MQTRILIADDHEVVRQGVRSILDSHNDFVVCGEAANGQEAVDKTEELKPDVIILDIRMPILNGFEAARIIKKSSPHIPIVILSMHNDGGSVNEARNVGVQGYVAKTDAGEKLIVAVEAVTKNETFFPA